MLSGNPTSRNQEKSLEAFGNLFGKYDCQQIETAILQSADPFLESAGEDLRRRMFVTTGAAGEELCLRPDFTIPVCLHHLQSNTDLPCRYGYFGPVFRQRGDGPGEFLQAGVEHLGRTEMPQVEDGEIMAIAVEACTMPDAKTALTLKLGDPSLFYQLLTSLSVPDGLRNRLIRAFGRGLTAETLASVLTPNKSRQTALPAPLQQHLNDPDALAMAIAEMMQAQGISVHSGRSPQDIANRYLESYGPQDFGLDNAGREHLQNVLSAYLLLDGPAQEMSDQLKQFESKHAVSFGSKLESFSQRLVQFESNSNAALLNSFVFSAGFARPLDYYTGFVFELFVGTASRPVAGGGRYDRLMEILGSNISVPAVGFSLWLDRLPDWMTKQLDDEI